MEHCYLSEENAHQATARPETETLSSGLASVTDSVRKRLPISVKSLPCMAALTGQGAMIIPSSGLVSIGGFTPIMNIFYTFTIFITFSFFLTCTVDLKGQSSEILIPFLYIY
jgi:hypothetical protein